MGEKQHPWFYISANPHSHANYNISNEILRQNAPTS